MPPGLSPCRSARRDEQGTRRLSPSPGGRSPTGGRFDPSPPTFIARTLCSNGRTEIPVLQPNRFETATVGVFNLNPVWVILAYSAICSAVLGLLAEVPRAAAIDVFARFAPRQYYVSSFTITFRQTASTPETPTLMPHHL
jgi:hypothetical protein